jgi:UDP-N-acetylglucosamine--N-acetylmuramyl-(pentapeptide) pyrophosphoryl-undecaprenol N-acetylglucosamine transferase
MSIKRVLITAGGTGGHLYPAQALAQQLAKRESSLDVLFMAGGLATNRCFDRTRFPFREIACSPLLSRDPLQCVKGLMHLGQGIRQSLLALKHYQPDVVVGFGSYYTVSPLLAARWLQIPIVLHEANSKPGKANQWLASLATYIGIHFPETASYFKGKKVVEVGLPLREGYHLAANSREQALAYYHLSPQRPTLLVCGGSQGARAINQSLQACLPVLQRLDVQVIHLTGSIEIADALTATYAAYQIPACVKAFETEMQMAWRAADLFVGRAGASTIAEAIEFEVPGLLIPYPYANQHQEKNADFFVEIGGGYKLLEPTLTIQQLSEKLEHCFEDTQRVVLQDALKAYKQRPHQTTLCQLILNMNSLQG